MDGILVICKPKGCTSHDIVYKVKKICNEKVGHTGTLDPNASGVLPILIGNGTKLSKYLINHDKKYIATIKLGEKTDTADVEGNIIETKDVDNSIFKNDFMNNILLKFIGKQEQTPPIYSAIKVNGKKLYEYARKGKSVEIPKREIEIYDIKLLGFEADTKKLEIEVSCSKGTYIRSLCEDIAQMLGTVGYMKELKRTMVGNFCMEDSIELEVLIKNPTIAVEKLITIEMLLKDNDSIVLEDCILQKFLNGVKIQNSSSNGLYKIYNKDGLFIGTGCIENGTLKRDIII